MKEQLEEACAVPDSGVDVMAGVTQVLEYYELWPTQIRVYLKLARHGTMKVTDLVKGLGVHRTEVYKTLNELMSLGLASKSLDRPATFTALSFRDAVRLLWSERRRTLDSVQLRGDVLAAAFERMPPLRQEEAPQTSFTRYKDVPTMRLRSRIESLSLTCSRRAYYLDEQTHRHFADIIDSGGPANRTHPELGSFMVLGDRVILLKKDGQEEWGALVMRMPEIVEAYALLVELLEGEL